jgi:hypothetical protein
LIIESKEVRKMTLGSKTIKGGEGSESQSEQSILHCPIGLIFEHDTVLKLLAKAAKVKILSRNGVSNID